MLEQFERTTNGFNFVFERELDAGETVFVKLPSVSPNKRGINAIGWQTDTDATLYGTLSSNPEDDTALWQELNSNEEVNKTIYAIKIVNGGSSGRVVIRAILA